MRILHARTPLAARSGPMKRALRTTAAAVLLSPLAVAATAAGPAHAADTVTCRGTTLVYAVTTKGDMLKYRLARPSANDSAFATGGIDIGSGWNRFGKVLGGPDGRIYGISATDGLFRYRYNGTGWDTVDGSEALRISDSFKSYATGYKDKITVDERGDFYLIDSKGKLRQYRYDEQTRSWTVFGRVLATGWDRYNLIIATTVGTLMARQPDGKIFRHRFDPESQRWIEQDRQMSTSGGWGFPKMFSMGGDTIFAVNSNTESHLLHYRFREDNGSWPVSRRQIGHAWGDFTSVTANSDSCTLTATHTPARPVTPAARNTPVTGLQVAAGPAAVGDLHFYFTNAIGQLVYGRKSATNGTVTWTAEEGFDAFTSRPTLLDDGAGGIRMFAQNANSELWTRTQPASAVAWGPWLNLAGAMVSTPTAVRLSDKSYAAFGVSADGAAWARDQEGTAGDLLPWTTLGKPGAGLVGSITATAVADRTVVLLATDSAGAVFSARYRDGKLVSAWTGMGGPEALSAPSTVLMPGYLLRVFARTADGHVVTQIQDSSGAFPGVWQRVGGDDFVGTGAPSALLNPSNGLTTVFSRKGDEVYFVQETGPGTATWRAPVIASNPDHPVASDPVALVYRDSDGVQVSFVVRTPDGGASVYLKSGSVGDARVSAKSRAFTRQDLTNVPK